MQKERRRESPLTVRYPNCAGIDVGKKELYVAVSEESAEENVQQFGTYTAALQELSKWLGTCGVEQVAMEATGVYWIPVYEVLERAGFEVRLVDPRATKRSDGRKTDVLDCQWIRQLMSLGLLSGAYRTPDTFCALRSYVRQRERLIQQRSRQVLHMQKALTQMNVQLDNVLSAIVGKSGQAILRAIVAGERDPNVLAQYRDGRVKASEAEVARSLEGNWRAEHLHELAAGLRHFDFLENEIRQLEQLVEQETARLVFVPPDCDSKTDSAAAHEVRPLQQPCANPRLGTGNVNEPSGRSPESISPPSPVWDWKPRCSSSRNSVRTCRRFRRKSTSARGWHSHRTTRLVAGTCSGSIDLERRIVSGKPSVNARSRYAARNLG